MEKQISRQRKWQLKKVAEGKCGKCGKESDTNYLCKSCREKDKETRKRRKINGNNIS